jgi:hypothetical protein
MRIPVPGSDNWIDLKDIADLSAADDDAYSRVVNEAALAAQGSEVEITDDEGETSADGVSVVPRARKLTLTVEMLDRRRDDLLARLITGWSYDIPLPYNAASRELLPRAAGKALDTAVKPYQAELNDSGPKETTAAAGTSVNGSAGG